LASTFGFLWLYGSLWLFMAFYCSFLLFMAFTALYGSLWLLQLEEAKNQIPQKPARLDPPAQRPTAQAAGGGQRAIKIQNQNQWSSLVTTGVNVCSSVVPFGVISSIDGTSAVTAMKREDLRSVNLV
jgi:hypothetical protein